jgi:hypothetical protein
MRIGSELQLTLHRISLLQYGHAPTGVHLSTQMVDPDDRLDAGNSRTRL